MTDQFEAEFDWFVTTTIAETLSPVERKGLHDAFFHGALEVLNLVYSDVDRDLEPTADSQEKIDRLFVELASFDLKAQAKRADCYTKKTPKGNLPFLALTDFCDEAVPDINPRNASGWAKWLSQPQPDWGLDEAAQDKDTFEAVVTLMNLHLVKLPNVPDPNNLEASRIHINFPPETMYLHLMEGTIPPSTDPAELPLWISDRPFDNEMDVLKYMASSQISICAVVATRPYPGPCTFTYHATADGPLGTIKLHDGLPIKAFIE